MKKVFFFLLFALVIFANTGFGPVENNRFIQTELKTSERNTTVKRPVTSSEEYKEVQESPTKGVEEAKSRSISEKLGEWLIGGVSLVLKAIANFVLNLFH